MLLLLILVAWAGWKGMGDMARRSDLQNDMGGLLRDAERGRLLAVEYMRAENEDAAAKVLAHLKAMKDDILLEREKFKDPKDLEELEEVFSMVDAYEGAFLAYTWAVEDASTEETVMVESARQLFDASQKAVKSLEDEMAYLMSRMAGAAQGTSQQIASLASVMEEALEDLRETGIIIEQILQVRQFEKNYLLRGEIRSIQELYDAVTVITTSAEMLRGRIDEEAAERMALLIDHVQEYQRAFDEFVQSRLDFFDLRGASLLGRAVEVLQETPERLVPEQLRTLGRTLGCRITMVDEDGTVLGDSQADALSMGNHGDRPEIIAALESGEGSAERFSGTLGVTMHYYARRMEAQGKPRIVRVAFNPLQASLVLAGSDGEQEIAWQRQLQQSMEEYARDAVTSARELQELMRAEIARELIDCPRVYRKLFSGACEKSGTGREADEGLRALQRNYPGGPPGSKAREKLRYQKGSGVPEGSLCFGGAYPGSGNFL